MQIILQSNRRRRMRGVTILESVMGIVISGITATSMFAGLISGMDQVDEVRRELRAMQIFSEKFETLRLYSWDQINEPDFIPASFVEPFIPGDEDRTGVLFYGTVALSDPPASVVYTNDMKQVTVTLWWGINDRFKTNSMSTLVSQYGVQNYVY